MAMDNHECCTTAMDYEIARDIAEVIISKLAPEDVLGQDISKGDTKAIGTKYGELYKEILKQVRLGMNQP
ncbi:hypothetical protein ACFLX5_05000 [Chloroflexota bacterium]